MKIRDLACALHETFFCGQARKIFKTLGLLDGGGELSSQNLEPLGLTRKIFFSKNLAGLKTEPQGLRSCSLIAAYTALALAIICARGTERKDVGHSGV